ncbi:MAG: hypothetical protein IJJ38_10170 [Lachnospiraceae bacterium]|nr:hypothetical protein [Lachnospiraceae bacterium]
MATFSLAMLIMCFGAGIFGAGIGGLATFIITGVIATIEAVCALTGATGGIAGMFALAFQLFPPNVFFVGAAGAAAVSAMRGTQEHGEDMTKSVFGNMDPVALLAGGIIAALSYVLRLFTQSAGFQAVLPTDSVCAVAIPLMIVIRLVFGKSGLTGNKEARRADGGKYVPTGSRLANDIILGLACGTMVSGLTIVLDKMGVDVSPLPVFFFGVTAITLMFMWCGSSSPATHHIANQACYATVLALPVMGYTGAAVVGVVTGIVTSVLGDILGMTFNSYHDTHIDPPAFAILIVQLVLGWIFL